MWQVERCHTSLAMSKVLKIAKVVTVGMVGVFTFNGVLSTKYVRGLISKIPYDMEPIDEWYTGIVRQDDPVSMLIRYLKTNYPPIDE
jgi:hypothetical protein